MKLRRWLFHVHLYTGLLIGLLLSLTGITGSLLVYGHELDALLYPRLLHAQSHGPGARPVTPDQVLEAVRRHHSGATVQFIAPPREAGDTYQAYLKGGSLAHVDPYSGRVVGVRAPTDHPIGFLFALHTELLSGENGERAVGVGGLLLLLLGVTGLILWWPGRPVGDGFRIQWRGSWKRVNWDLHRVGGAVSVVLLSLIALTGAALVWGAEVTDWTHRLTRTPPRPRVVSTPLPGARPLSLAELAAHADAALPGATTTRISLASRPEAAAVIRKKLPQELHPNGMSFVSLDQYTGRVLLVENALAATPGPRLLALRYPLHIGHWGGPLVRVLYVLVGLTPAFLFVTGCLMWWNRYWVPRRRRATRLATAARPASGELELPHLERTH